MSSFAVDGEHDADVELSESAPTTSHFFLDGASPWSVGVLFALLLSFLLMHIFAAFRAPPLFENKRDYFPVDNTIGNHTFDIDISLRDVTPRHCFIAMNFFLTVNTSNTDLIIPTEVTVHRTTIKDFLVVKNFPEDIVRHNFSFLHSNYSETFDVVHLRDFNFDDLEVRIIIECNYTGLVGVDIRWNCTNPFIFSYRGSFNFLLAFAIGYMFIVFMCSLRLDTESFTEMFVLVLGFSGLVATRPFNFFMKTRIVPIVFDSLVVSVFVALFRMFVIVELVLLRLGRTAIGRSKLLGVALLFAVYAACDTAASFARQSHMMLAEVELPVVFRSELAVMRIDLAFHVLSFLCLFWATGCDAGRSRRLWFFGFCVIVSDIATFIAHVWCVSQNILMYSLVPSLIFLSTHITLTTMILFFFHSGARQSYKDLRAHTFERGDVSGALGIEQASDSPEQAGFE